MSVNVDDILQFKFDQSNRRTSDENSAPSAKRARIHDAKTEEEVEQLLKTVEDQEIEQLDERGVKKFVVNFEKRSSKNQEMRIKFPDQPEKFMESELDLSISIQEMHAIATVPHLYSVLVELNVVEMFVQLMNHDNADIACAVVHLLQELTDVDTLQESEEGATILVNSLIDAQIVTHLVKNLERLDETNKDEADGVYNTLAVIENITEFKPEICSVCVQQGFLSWLIKRLKSKTPFEANRLYCAEILAVLLQTSEECKRSLGDMDGIDVLLQQLASYKRHNPSNVDEIEYMENLFNSLCAALMEKSNLKRFLDGEGLQLMNLMLREKKMSRESALKVLDYATTGTLARDNCDKFVDIYGLRTLFPLFMQTPSKNKRKGRSAEEHEEHACAVVASLLKHCSAPQRQRVLSKFVESDYEKIERLVELHFKYAERVAKFEKEIANELKNRKNDDDDLEEDEIYMRKLDSGLFTLQLIDFVLADVVVNGSSTIRDRVVKLMNMKKSSLKVLTKTLQEYVDNLGTEIANEKNVEKSSILALINSL